MHVGAGPAAEAAGAAAHACVGTVAIVATREEQPLICLVVKIQAGHYHNLSQMFRPPEAARML